MSVTDIYFFSGTHWDREWYQDYQGFRFRLVKMVDEMIDYLEEDNGFGVYHFDGQTIVLEDYNQIAPENADRLKKLISDGKIKIGPWYDMPDEFLLSGESLIRNLMTGSKVAKEWGAEAWKYGYCCDIFGHIAQLPQIFNGFGIDMATIGRGANEEDESFLRWQSPDGSECMTFVIDPDGGYGGFFLRVMMDKSDADIETKVKKYVDREIARSNSPVLFLMDGNDHQVIHKDTPEYIEIIKKLYPEINVHHCDLLEAADKLSEVRESIPKRMGELSKTTMKNRYGFLWLITNTLSSYYTHKKMNDECQILLEKEVEPLMTLAAFQGKPFRRSYVDLAYNYLLKNHPHDSICGCSVAQVHKDMVYRFDQVKEISKIIKEEYIFEERPESGEEHNYILKLYNPLPFARKETVTAGVELGANFPTSYHEAFGYEEIYSFKLLDINGNEIPYARKEVIKNYKKRYVENKTALGECYFISFEAEIPACGYAEYKVIPYEKPVRYLETMLSGEDYAENDFVRVEISSDGEISIYDKKTDKKYEKLCSFVDDGEIGDGWFHTNPVNDILVYSKGKGAKIEKIEIGPARCVFRVTKEMSVPACVVEHVRGIRRSDRSVVLPLVMEIGLSKNARYADVKLAIKNTAEDHRMRMVIPTGIKNDTYFTGQAFYCNERKVGINYNSSEWTEPEKYEKQMNGIVGKRESDGSGIAFISAAGLHECAGYDDGNIMVTLFRAFRKTVETMGEPEGQLLKELSYSFLLAPTDKNVTYAELVKLQDILAVKPIESCSEVKAGCVPGTKSFMRIDGDNIILSIIKLPEDKSENAMIVRIFNASGETSDGKIVLDKNIESAYETNLNEVVEREIKVNKNELSISLTPWKIKTYKIVIAKN